jgi:hypothetical protein
MRVERYEERSFSEVGRGGIESDGSGSLRSRGLRPEGQGQTVIFKLQEVTDYLAAMVPDWKQRYAR